MPAQDIIVIGASAGGVDAYMQLVRLLPKDLNAAVLMVLHLAPDGLSALPKILNRVGTLPAEQGVHGEEIQPGRVYVAPPDYHMLVQGGRIHLVAGPRENGSRPAIDPLFRTAARTYGKRVLGVLLTGLLDDGTEGLSIIKKHGGVTVAQDPDEALYASMPRNAIETVGVDYVLTIEEIGLLIQRLAPAPGSVDNFDLQVNGDPKPDIIEIAIQGLEYDKMPGERTHQTCPECGGVLWESTEDRVIRYRCPTGHGFSLLNLELIQSRALEAALWTAVQVLEENAALSRRLADRLRKVNNTNMIERFEEKAREAQERAAILRQVFLTEKRIVETDKPTSELREKLRD